jgi:hypothetical protein
MLTLIFDSAVWSIYDNELHMVLNTGTAKIAVIIRADREIVVSVSIS